MSIYDKEGNFLLEVEQETLVGANLEGAVLRGARGVERKRGGLR